MLLIYRYVTHLPICYSFTDMSLISRLKKTKEILYQGQGCDKEIVQDHGQGYG
jgi:hypothetical protein